MRAMERPRLDPERQRQARVYARLRRRAALLERGLAAAYLAVWVATDAARPVAAWVETRAPGSWPIAVLAVAATLSLPWALLTMPLSFYAGFHLPHRFGQSTQRLGAWLVDQIKGLIVGAALGTPLLLALYALMRASPADWWLMAAAGYGAFVFLLSIVAPVLLMPIFHRYRPLGEEHAELVERLTRLSAAAGRHVRGVYAFDMSRRTRSANAALVGLGGTRRIVVGDTLLAEFPPEEIEAVLAHELGHHVHADLPMGVAVGTLAAAAALWATQAVLTDAVARGALASAGDPAGFPLVSLVFFVAGLLGGPLQRLYSRWRERRADDFAVRLTGRPAAFADAMVRLANQNLADADPPRWAVILDGTHPPLAERIRRAEAASPASPP